MSATTSRAGSGYLEAPFVALAHRGFSRAGLENSMAAFAAARDLGLRYVETDAHATSDGVAIALHDASLDRTTDAHGLVADLPWRTVRAARIGGTEPVPSLEDVLGTWPDLRVNVDVKSAAAAEPVARAIERTRAHDRVCVASFAASRREATVARLSRPVTVSGARGAVLGMFLAGRARTDALARLAARSVDCLQVPVRGGWVRVVDSGFVRAAHRAGVAVHAWTVNDRATMHRLLDLGVDGIVTDRADLLRDVLRARGLWA
ncbi:glycerophosphodiester phosphodiesterase family protein [Cellulosimicrobium cellulans]|uniref:Glycerophosphodiester phosphodiesterase n=1 Tax=Cellulosimicrobium funkei TaxID=264251 RepID=A0A0H2KIS5_9MICO|nr:MULTISPECIES: glycerophosphodiester phosphodiesterase family protein [Cellulosimicrobium]KLN33371.1 glycerophosphodiester phosphodiesterase [Cellulosimicrobium funkei]KZM78128.1 glycerophosphodiester phosphodiesterase [Cellulosimicrobium sp. I38E]